MPFLDWVNKAQAVQVAAGVPFVARYFSHYFLGAEDMIWLARFREAAEDGGLGGLSSNPEALSSNPEVLSTKLDVSSTKSRGLSTKPDEALAPHFLGLNPYNSNDDSREKAQVGHQCESSSGGRCLFLMAVAQDEQGRDVAAQIENKIGQLQ